MPQTHCDSDAATLLSVDEALQHIQTSLTPINAGDTCIALRQALGRVLATDIVASFDLPRHPTSAMDGYALHSADLAPEQAVELEVVGEVFAGKPLTLTVQRGQCVRIFTGAVLPDGTDTVVMQEVVSVTNQRATIPSGQQPQQHCNQVGTDVRQGDTLLQAGRRLQVADIGLLASLGIPDVPVKRLLRVGFFSTGDELRPVGQPLETGQIYDSNRYTLYGLLQNLNVQIDDKGVVADDPQALETALQQAAQDNDVVITTGGVSVGDADYVTEVLRRIGTVQFWKIAMKPGKPLTFGQIGNAVFFGLPGNPVSTMTTFIHFVTPAIQQLAGAIPSRPLRIRVPAVAPLRKRPGRQEFQRGVLSYDAQGQLQVRATAQQSSAMLSTMSQANCFIVLPADCTGIAVGERVWVEPFSTHLT